MIGLRRAAREWAGRDRGPILLLAVVVASFFLPALVTPGALIWPNSGFGSDIVHRHWPDLVGYAAHWRAGQLPTWDSSVALGRPLAGDPGVMFLYPFDLFFLIFPPALAFNLLDALHVFLAGLFTYLLLRVGYGTARPAALLGGLAFAFAPKFIAHLAGGHEGVIWGLAWAPAVLLGLELAFDGSLLAAALSGLALAVSMPLMIQISFYTAAIASALWLWRIGPVLWQAVRGGPDRGADLNRGEGRPSTPWRPAGRLAAVYAVWLLAFGLLAAFILLPLLELLPYNSRDAFTLADANLYALPPYLLLTLLAPTLFQFPEWVIFVGVLPPVLAGAGWLVQARRSERWFYASLAGFALVHALGLSTPLFGLAFALIPGFSLFRVPTRLWFFGVLAVAVLAGFGADVLTDAGLREKLWRRRRWLARVAGLYFAGGGVAFVGYFAFFRRWHWLLGLQLITAALLVLLGSAWLRRRLSGPALQWALIPVLLFDLLPLAANYIRLIDPQASFLRATPALEFVLAQPGIFRVYSPAGDIPYAVAAERGVETLEGLLSLQMEHAVQVIREATGCTNTRYATAVPACLYDRVPAAIPDPERLGWLNVRYVLSSFPLAGPDFTRVLDGSPAVYENRRWQPRAFLIGGAGEQGNGGMGEVEIVGRRAGEYEIAVRAEEAVWLVVSEAWAPGWQARVDEQPAVVGRVEGALIGLSLGPGEHHVRLNYAPPGWRVGWPISLGALLGLGGWVVVASGRKARGGMRVPCR